MAMEASSDWKEFYRQGLESLAHLQIDLPLSTKRLSYLDKSHSAAESKFLEVMSQLGELRTKVLEEWNEDMPLNPSESDSSGDDDVDDSDDRDVGLRVVDDARPPAGSNGEDDQSLLPRTPYVPPVAATGPLIHVYKEVLEQSLTRHQQMRDTIDQLRKQLETLEAALALRVQSPSFPESSLQTNIDRRSSHSASSKLSEVPTPPLKNSTTP